MKIEESRNFCGLCVVRVGHQWWLAGTFDL